nr:Flp family type IVb pilin [uncultured Duganella sp.]
MRKSTLHRSSRRQRGQGMMEYVIIVAMIAVAAIGVYSVFGQTIRNQTAGLTNEVAGKKADTQISAAQATAATASSRANTQKGMGEYNLENDAK